MAAPELTVRTAGPARATARAAFLIYVALWGMTLLGVAIVVLVPPVGHEMHRLLAALGLRLTGEQPSPSAALSRWLANARVTALPVLLAAFGATATPRMRPLADALILASLTANAVLVGAAIGAVGPRLLAYLPHLPIEWAALACAAAPWAAARRAPRLGLRRDGWTLALPAAGVLLAVAAIMETYLTPHA